MNSGAIGGIAAAVGVPLVMLALRRSYPGRPASVDDRSLAELTKDYRRWDIGLALLWFVCCPVGGVVLYWTFQWLIALESKLLDPAPITLLPASASILLPVLFITMALSAWTTVAIARWRLGTRFAEFLRFSELRYGVDPRAYRIMLTGYSAVCAIWIVLMLDWNVRFADQNIVIRRFWSFAAEEHAYTDIIAIVTAPFLTAPNGKRVARREYSIHFNDGSVWSTDYEPSDSTEEQKRSIATYLSARSGIPITETDQLTRHDQQ